MNQHFKKWIVGKIDEGFRDEARVQFLSMLKNEPEKVKTYIRDNIEKFYVSYISETHNASLHEPGVASQEILLALKEHLAAELVPIPCREDPNKDKPHG